MDPGGALAVGHMKQTLQLKLDSPGGWGAFWSLLDQNGRYYFCLLILLCGGSRGSISYPPNLDPPRGLSKGACYGHAGRIH